MKRTAFIVLMLTAALGAAAQNHQYTRDPGEHIVKQYVRLLNIDALPSDSMLVMTTYITSPVSTDTTVMRRWYMAPQMFRVEVWNGKNLAFAICSNGKDRYRQLSKRDEWWVEITPEQFHDHLGAYDFRGPLYDWQNAGAVLTFKGTTSMKGQKLDVVEVEEPGHYTRQYFFEQSSGLLTLILEDDEIDPDYYEHPEARIDWKIMHEFVPVGQASLLPSQESFMRDGYLTILTTTYSLEPRNTLIFNQD